MTWATPNAVELLILALAGYRIFRFLSIDEFPGMPAARVWVTDSGGRKWADDLLACPFCLGFWISLALVLAWWAWPVAALAFALPWAVAAILALVTVHLDPS